MAQVSLPCTNSLPASSTEVHLEADKRIRGSIGITAGGAVSRAPHRTQWESLHRAGENARVAVRRDRTRCSYFTDCFADFPDWR
jgi:hypothetical protein